MKDFIALARANPDKYNCATPPIGTTSQLQLELLKIREKLPKLEDVVFKGGGDAIAALLAARRNSVPALCRRHCRISRPVRCAVSR